jgi:YbbR domain-containing protein
MDSDNKEQFSEKLSAAWNRLFNKPDEDGMTDAGREKVVVFLVAFVLALFLWLMVNLGRDFNLNINLPITLGNVPPDRALAEELPKFATVSISGEGWSLINVYNNPPQIYVDVAQQEVSLYEQVRQQMNAVSDLNVLKVQPLFLNVELDERVSKKVPVRSNVRVTFEEQHDFVGRPSITPDSVTITGAESLVEDNTYWETDTVQISEAKDPVSQTVPLQDPGSLLSLSTGSVRYTANVAQYTEGETRVFVQPRGMPEGQLVSFSPSSITVKYNVPIQEYAEVSDMPELFTAYVDYEQIRRDSTGFVVPKIVKPADSPYHYELRSFQPAQVAYFIVLGN